MMRTIELEKNRLALIEKRDGKEAAIEFAKRTMGLYRRHILKYKNLIARRNFIISYLEFKAYYLNNRHYKYYKINRETIRMRFKLYREKAGVISNNRIWVFIDNHGYLYLQESLLRLAIEVVTEWKQDRHLVG